MQYTKINTLIMHTLIGRPRTPKEHAALREGERLKKRLKLNFFRIFKFSNHHIIKFSH